MGTICSQASFWSLQGLLCGVYDFQTLLVGAAAILVAILAAIPVWRQLKDTNLQTRISHRETLASLLRDTLQRYGKVAQSVREPFQVALRATRDPDGEPIEINPHDAHGLEQMFRGVLDWYLVILADTEHADIEARKSELIRSMVNCAHVCVYQIAEQARLPPCCNLSWRRQFDSVTDRPLMQCSVTES